MELSMQTEADASPAVQLAELRARAETELLGAIFAEPAAGVAAAGAAGISFHDFGQPDLRIIFLAAETAGARGAEVVCVLARRALQDGGFWDDSQVAGNHSRSMLWSDASLAALATSAYPNAELVRVRAERLLWLIRAEHIGQKLLNRAEAVLQMAVSPVSFARRLV